jgi:hypothetical protein
MSTFLILDEKINDFKLENTLFNIYQNIKLKVKSNSKSNFSFDNFLQIFENNVLSVYSENQNINKSDKVYLGFDYSNKPKDITDYTFWIVVTATINNEDYLYHKLTGCIIDVVEGEAYLYGIYKPEFNPNILYPYSFPEFVIDWISNCSIKF